MTRLPPSAHTGCQGLALWSLALGHGSFPSPHPERPFWHSVLEPQPRRNPGSLVLERHMEKLLGSPNHASSSQVSAQDCGFWAGAAVGADPSVLPLPEKRVPLRILYEEYRDKLTQDNLIKVVALLNDHQTGDILVAVRDIYVENPKIKIRVRVRCPVPGRFEENELL